MRARGMRSVTESPRRRLGGRGRGRGRQRAENRSCGPREGARTQAVAAELRNGDFDSMAPMSFLRAPYDGRASQPDMTATAEAAVVMSPELALVDPALRAVALEQLEAVGVRPTSFAARASRRAAAGATARQLDADDSRVRVDRRGRRHHYVLAASLLANVFLIGIIVSGFPSRSSSVAHERTAAPTPSVDAAAAGADGVIATESTAQPGAGAGVFVPALRPSGVTTTRPSDPRDSKPVERAASTARSAAGAAPGAA